MKTITLYKYGKPHPMTFRLDHYADNGNLFVGLVTHEEGYPEMWSNLTVNLQPCKANRAFIDTNNNQDIVRWLLKHKLGRLTGAIKRSGFCLYPEFEFDMEMLKEYME